MNVAFEAFTDDAPVKDASVRGEHVTYPIGQLILDPRAAQSPERAHEESLISQMQFNPANGFRLAGTMNESNRAPIYAQSAANRGALANDDPQVQEFLGASPIEPTQHLPQAPVVAAKTPEVGGVAKVGDKAADPTTKEYDYVIVGSGAGGAPLAANLAEAGYSVCVLEMGGDQNPTDAMMPALHPVASEDPRIAGSYFVRHYADDDQQRRDSKFVESQNGIDYPRGITVGGSPEVNALITKRPYDSDFDELAKALGDPSWSSKNMQKYWERMEDCQYRPFSKVMHKLGKALNIKALQNLGGHGYDGWLTTTRPSLTTLLKPGGMELAKILWTATKEAVGEQHTLAGKLRSLLNLTDPNKAQGPREGVEQMALAVDKHGRRSTPRQRMLSVQEQHPDRLTIQPNSLATRVIMDGDKAVGVEFVAGAHQYRADPKAPPTRAEVPLGPTQQVRAKREVILSAGAFGDPQLLKLTGIGPQDELRRLGIKPVTNLPGVGENLQDRYEVGVVSEMEHPDFLKGATFSTDAFNDPHLRDWLEHGKGIYETNGSIISLVKKSDPNLKDPDLYIFGIPAGVFKGYYPGYSVDGTKDPHRITWVVLKAKSHSRGSVTLKSADPRDTPNIDLRYFQGTGADSDAQAIVAGVRTVRSMNDDLSGTVGAELWPGPAAETDKELADWIKREAWGHHASCSVKIGPDSDPLACLNGDFTVKGTQGLRVVSLAVAPEIPGMFPAAYTYMISEKASDDILKSAREQDLAAARSEMAQAGSHAQWGTWGT
jgi:choline dehydrogenase